MSHDTSTTPNQPNELLTFLTTSLRRITLICKLLSPLLISFSTTFIGYPTTAAILLGAAGVTLASEIMWIGVVWRKFQVLEEQEVQRQKPTRSTVESEREQQRIPRTNDNSTAHSENHYSLVARDENGDNNIGIRGSNQHPRTGSDLIRSAQEVLGTWNEFRKMPVFLSKLVLPLLLSPSLSLKSSFSTDHAVMINLIGSISM